MFHDIKAFCKWALIAVAVGIAAGLVGTAFHYGVEWVTELRGTYPWLIFLLPAGGVCIAGIYKLCGAEKDGGTNYVLDTVREDKKVPLITLPVIFISTIITHLCGGSSGREGAALQIGSSISDNIGRLIHLDEKDMHIMTMCGMAAAFSALFGTPVTAAVFSIEVVSIGIMHFSALVPCMISALTGLMTAQLFHVAPTRFVITEMVVLTPVTLVRVVCLSVLCAFVSILFCLVMKQTAKLYQKFVPNPFLKAAAGGLIVIALTLAVGSQYYNGAGMGNIDVAFHSEVPWYVFLVKLLFTACTLGAGFKGGEIVPAFFTGAAFGNAASRLAGLPASFGTGIGLVCLFCGVTNCPLTSVILSVELFGSEGLPFFAAACAASYMLSGYTGLYTEQKIMYSKTKAEYIDRKTM